MIVLSMLLRRPWLHALTALMVVALGAGVLEQAFALHTDDGCEVETHCLACRLTLGAVSLATAAPPTLERAAVSTEIVWITEEQLLSESVRVALPARAPPSAS
jgi:hypothetical protein